MQLVYIGILQGSPISPILFLIYIRDICKPRPNTLLLSYIDDFCLGTTSTLEKKNCKILTYTIQLLIKEAKELAIKFNASKTELLHVSSKKQQSTEPIQIGD